MAASSTVSIGDTVLASDYNELRADVDHIFEICVFKTADEIVNNSTALQDDDHLKITVGANDKLHFKLVLLVTSVGVANIDLAFSVPSGGLGKWWAVGADTDDDVPILAASDKSLTTEDRISPSSGTQRVKQFEGYYIGGGNAGILQLQWAQGVATVGDSTLHAESHMIAIFEQ